MNATSPWLLNAGAILNDPALAPFHTLHCGSYSFNLFNLEDAIWIVASWPKGSRIAFRLAYSPNDRLEVRKILDQGGQLTIQLTSLLGAYEVVIDLPENELPVLHCRTTLQPTAAILFPYWPRDIVPLGAAGSDILAEGEVKVSQVGTRSGQLYFSLTRPKAGSVLYLQNLTALADYNQQTETSAGDTVGGEWPEIGFALPPT